MFIKWFAPLVLLFVLSYRQELAIIYKASKEELVKLKL